jgi:hypothetical protein
MMEHGVCQIHLFFDHEVPMLIFGTRHVSVYHRVWHPRSAPKTWRFICCPIPGFRVITGTTLFRTVRVRTVYHTKIELSSLYVVSIQAFYYTL